MMIPTQEFERLQDFYKGQISQSALLNKAGRLAAEKHLILKNPKIPDAMAVKMTKPMAREQVRLTKRIRTGSVPLEGVGTPDPNEYESMVDSPLENLLRKIVKQTGQTPGPATPHTSRVKMEPATTGPLGVKIKPPVPPKPSTLKTPQLSTSKKKSGGYKKAALSGAAKGFLRSIGIDPKFIDDDDKEDESGGYTPKGAKGKQLKKAKKTETEKLTEGGKGGTILPRGNLVMARSKPKRTRKRQRGRGFNIQKMLGKTGIEFHWPGYQYMGPGTHLIKRLKRGDPGINRLDRIAKQHDIDYSRAQNLQDKWKADTKMIKAIDNLPGNKTMTERIVKRIMQAKKRLKL